ncbi:hypothetical protein BP6252_04051 [Coleophoma cylindrospora]|uniref:Uncharacterized protein n=1 Tax=Coleophoma cylindrospora TaxID=1849047 RepID=A0A3D8RZD5_9HELO|nr:hypothetical protein BP6252_04051 [Coleophoma cylindrospora]
MAPVTASAWLATRAYRNRVAHSSGSSLGGGVGGGVIAVIIIIAIIIFIVVALQQYKKGEFLLAFSAGPPIHPSLGGSPFPTGPSPDVDAEKQRHLETGAPIRKSKIFKKAAIIAVTFGLASCLCAECCGIGDNEYEPASQPTAEVPGGSGGGFVPQPMPTYQPEMNWEPQHGAAVDPVV